MAERTFVVADVVTGEVIAEPSLNGFTWTEEINGVGSWEASIARQDPNARKSVLTPASRMVAVAEGGTVHFAGGIFPYSAEASSAKVTIGGTGLLGYYAEKRRKIRSRLGMTAATGTTPGDVVWSAGTDPFEIAQDLFAHALITSAADLAPTLRYNGSPTPISGAAIPDDIETQILVKGILEQLDELTLLEAAAIDYTTGYFYDNDAIDWSVDFHYPHAGIRSGVTLEPGGSVSVLEWNIDGGSAANLWDLVGRGQGDDQIRTSIADTSVTPQYPLLERSQSFKSVQSATELQAIGSLMLPVFITGLEGCVVEVVDESVLPLGSVSAGDIVNLGAGDDIFAEVEGSWRCLSLTVELNDQGDATQRLELIPETAYGSLFAA